MQDVKITFLLNYTGKNGQARTGLVLLLLFNIFNGAKLN